MTIIGFLLAALWLVIGLLLWMRAANDGHW